MLIKLLSDPDKRFLLELARLLALSDNPLLCDGKSIEELTPTSDLSSLCIQENDLERELLSELELSARINSQTMPGSIGSPKAISDKLIKALKTHPLSKLEQPETRLISASRVLTDLLKSKSFDLPSAPKIILYELFLVALRDGHISSIEWSLLKEYQNHYEIEDFIFKDLLERAESLNQEMSKTISLVLE